METDTRPSTHHSASRINANRIRSSWSVGPLLGTRGEFYRNERARDTVVLVNGALGTTTIFAHTIKYLNEHFNVLAYDLPFAGKSKRHNDLDHLLSQEDEIGIFLALIARFECSHVLALSWGQSRRCWGWLADRPG